MQGYSARIIRIVLVAGLVFTGGPSWSAGAGKPDNSLARRVLEILEKYRQNPEDWGILIRSLGDGDDLVSLNAGRRFMPASNLKLLVTSAALETLGPDFSYLTTVMGTGRLSRRDSLLDGDLVLRGSGDPTISDRFYPTTGAVWDSLANQVARAGIRRVSGSLLADNTLFEPPYLAQGWSWDDLMWWYAAPVSALSYNDNCIDLEVFPAQRVGEPPLLKVGPQGTVAPLLNRARTVGDRGADKLTITRESPGGRIQVSGGIYHRSPGFLEHVAVESPAAFAAGAFADALARKGVRIDGPVRVLEAPQDQPDYLEKSPVLLAQHESVPLREVVRVINKRSHNFYAEQLLLTLGVQAGGGGTFERGVQVEERFLRKLGLDTGRLRIVDASGLSRLNLVTPEMFVRLLAYMDRQPLKEDFVSSLPVGGIDNGVRTMRHTSAEGMVHAKTGYITGVIALSGYAETRDGERAAFSILGNNWLISRQQAQRLIRDVCVALAEFQRGFSPGQAAAKP